MLQQGGRKQDPVSAWLQQHRALMDKVGKMLNRMKSAGEMDYATLAVAVRALQQLADETD